MRSLADGAAPIGYLRRDAGKIHRPDFEAGDGEVVLRPPQECLNEREAGEWREGSAMNYAP